MAAAKPTSVGLTTITDVDTLKSLQALYRTDWPKHSIGYFWLDNFIRWLEQEPDLKHFTVYTLNDDWRSAGLFLIVHRYQIFFCALDAAQTEQMYQALSLLSWNNGYKISSVLEWCRAPLMRVLSEQHVAFEKDCNCQLYYMSRAEASKLDVSCPSGYYLHPLSVDDATTIDAHWSARHRGSLVLVKQLIARNANMGVYVQGSNELAAWCLRLQGGFLGALHSRTAFRRHGLGSLVARATAKRIACELEQDVLSLVYVNDNVAGALFRKLGFHATDERCSWLMSLPAETGELWPENE